MKISPRFTDTDWPRTFADKQNWVTAIEVVADRIRGRWLDYADMLVGQPHAGFAIIALDCIILESLWGFKNGKSVPRGKEQQAYRDILTSRRFGWTNAEADGFREFVRNGMIHDTETRRGWLIERTVPSGVKPVAIAGCGYKLNRTRFHNALKATVEDWLRELQSGDVDLRANMRDRMDQIIARHTP